MPWDVFKNGDEYCVHKLKPDGSKGARVSGGCHENEGDAENHRAALYANEKAWIAAARALHKIIYSRS